MDLIDLEDQQIDAEVLNSLAVSMENFRVKNIYNTTQNQYKILHVTYKCLSLFFQRFFSQHSEPIWFLWRQKI